MRYHNYQSLFPSLLHVTDDAEMPSNVMAREVLPQASILSHEKTLLYFGHGGVNGLHEAVHFRKPIVAMPVWWDGRESIQRMVKRGVALSVPKDSGADAIYDAIVAVRDDPKFRERANAMADLIHDRQSSPMEDAVWLAEYVSKTKGAGAVSNKECTFYGSSKCEITPFRLHSFTYSSSLFNHCTVHFV